MAKKVNNPYFGKAGHLFIMSELLLKKWNVAIPEVDIGDDIYVVQDNTGFLRRLQVKTSNIHKKGNYVWYTIVKKQIENELESSDLVYTLVVRTNETWKALIIPRSELQNILQETNLENYNDKSITEKIHLKIKIKSDEFYIKSKKQNKKDLSNYIFKWDNIFPKTIL